MIRREGVLAALGAAVLVATLGGAVATAAVAASATAVTRAAAARATPQPSPAYHRLADPDSTGGSTGDPTEPYDVRPLRAGDQPVTEAQMRAQYIALGWMGSDPGDPTGTIYITQRAMTSRCMAEHGFHYDPRVTTNPPGFAGSDAERALYGDADNGGATYDWHRAGCIGLAVHETGQDDAH